MLKAVCETYISMMKGNMKVSFDDRIKTTQDKEFDNLSNLI